MNDKSVTDEWDFGSDKVLADKLKDLVLSGKKTATTGLYKEGEKIPKSGEFAAIIGSDKKRFCIVQYTDSFIKSFLDVNWEYAKLEGEDNKDLEDWRQQHREFFKREYGSFDDRSLVVCVQFNLAQVL